MNLEQEHNKCLPDQQQQAPILYCYINWQLCCELALLKHSVCDQVVTEKKLNIRGLWFGKWKRRKNRSGVSVWIEDSEKNLDVFTPMQRSWDLASLARM